MTSKVRGDRQTERRCRWAPGRAPLERDGRQAVPEGALSALTPVGVREGVRRGQGAVQSQGLSQAPVGALRLGWPLELS